MPRFSPNDPVFDVLVVGAGPTGLATAIEGQRRGLRAVVIEKGCVVNSLYHYPTNMVFFTTSELLEIGDLPMTAVGEKPTRAEALKYYRKVAEHYRLDIRQYERVEEIKGSEGDFRVETIGPGRQRGFHRARKIVLATGYYDRANRLKVPGEELDKVFHYYKDPHPFYDCEVAVIGAGNSGAVAALECYRAGARVTLIHRDREPSPKIKYWIRPDLMNRIQKGEIQAFFESTVQEITPEAIRLHTPQGKKILPNDFVLAMIGYWPDVDFLARVGITFDPQSRRPRTNPGTFESERAGVYLAGVIVAGMNTSEIFIENGRLHGQRIAADIAAKLRASPVKEASR